MINLPPVENRTISGFLDAIASTEPMPGGGSVAGVTAAFGMALGDMVIQLTPDAPAELTEASSRLQALRASALVSSEADELAYADFLEALNLPKSEDTEKAHRREVMQGALTEAIAVPLQLGETIIEALGVLSTVVRLGNKRVLGDCRAAIALLMAAHTICMHNARENADMLTDTAAGGTFRGEIHELTQRATARQDALTEQINQRLAASSKG